MTADPVRRQETLKTCAVCWYGETPSAADPNCPCCRAGHYDGHFDAGGNPQ